VILFYYKSTDNDRIQMMKHFMVLINGAMGSGKTTIGRLVHSKLPRTAILSTDAIKFLISDFERGERDNAIATAVLYQMCREYIRQEINTLIPQGF
jgi:uridine kinase